MLKNALIRPVQIGYSNLFMIRKVISQSDCLILVRCMYLDTKWKYIQDKSD